MMGYSVHINGDIVKTFQKLLNNEINDNSAESLQKMRNRSLYNYYCPSSSVDTDKNKWELTKHYKVYNLYKGAEINVANLLERVTYVSDFHRNSGYDQKSGSSGINVDTNTTSDIGNNDSDSIGNIGNNIGNSSIGKRFINLSQFDKNNLSVVLRRTPYGGYLGRIKYNDKTLSFSLQNVIGLFINDKNNYGTTVEIDNRFSLVTKVLDDNRTQELEEIDKYIQDKVMEQLKSSIPSRRYAGIEHNGIKGMIRRRYNKDNNELLYKNLLVQIPGTAKITDGFNKLKLEELPTYHILNKKINIKFRVTNCWISPTSMGLTCIAQKIQIMPNVDSLAEILFTNSQTEDEYVDEYTANAAPSPTFEPKTDNEY